MTLPESRRIGLLSAVLLFVWVLPGAWAEVSGRMRIQQADGKWVTGEVEETPEAYIVTVARGIKVTIQKSQVKAIQPVEAAQTQPAAETPQDESKTPDETEGMQDGEIEKLLDGTGLGPPRDEELEQGELPLDEESVAEMKQLAGTENLLTTKHVAIVYTSQKKDAADLAARLESIWRWNMRFMKMIKLPVRLPPHKLELYYFGTHEEFNALRVNTGGAPDIGTLGFFTPVSNRSHFFDMLTWPPVKARLDAAKRASGPEKAREENLAKRWSEYETLSTTQHELGHHIHFNIGLFPYYAYIANESWDAMPVWLVEGTTMLFEVPPSSEGASLGATNYSRLAEFQKSYRQQWSPELMKLFLIDNRIWRSGYYYPMGWGLVYYLWEQKRPGLIQYYHIITARDPGDGVGFTQRERELEDCFGKIDKEWVDAFWKFMMQSTVKHSVLPPDDYP